MATGNVLVATADHVAEASQPIGTAAGDLVQLDGSGKLPAVDGSNLTGVGGGVTPVVSNKTDNYPLVAATDLGFGKIFTMAHADPKVFTLPIVAAGDLGKPVVLVKKGAGKVTIQANTGQFIADSTEAGQVYDDQAGELSAQITLMPVTTTLWVITGRDGTWTTE